MSLEAQTARQQQVESASVCEVFVNAAFKSALEDPINGLGQIVNKVADRNLVPELQITKPAVEAEFNSRQWYAQNFGAAVGMIPAFLLVRKGVKSVMPAAGGIVESTVSGAVYEGMFRPVEHEAPFFKSRLQNAAVGAATFGSMELAGLGLTRFGRTAVAEAFPVKPGLALSTALKSASSGTFGGLASAEASSLIHEGRLATSKEVLRSAYTYAIIGTGLSTVDAISNRPSPRVAQERLSLISERGQIADRRQAILDRTGAGGTSVDPTVQLLAHGNMEIIAGKIPEVEALLGKRPELAGIDQEHKLDSWDHAGVVVARVTNGSGGHVEAMVRSLESNNPFDLFKFERAHQAAAMHQLMGFEHGYLQVAERSVIVTPTESTTSTGEVSKPEVRKIWLEKKAGENAEDGLRRMARQKYGEGKDTDDHVVQLVNEHPALKDRLEDAFFERLLSGDLDVTAGNMVFETTGSTPDKPAPLQNIDWAQSYTTVDVASWSSNSGFWITDSLRKIFAMKPLSVRNQVRAESFLHQNASPEGQSAIAAKSGLHPDQVSAHVARTRDLLVNGFPEALEIADPRYDDTYVAQVKKARDWLKEHPPNHKLTSEAQK